MLGSSMFSCFITRGMLTLRELERCHVIYQLWERSVNDRDSIERLVSFLPEHIEIYMKWLITRWSKFKPRPSIIPTPTQACLHMQFLPTQTIRLLFLSASGGLSVPSSILLHNPRYPFLPGFNGRGLVVFQAYLAVL